MHLPNVLRPTIRVTCFFLPRTTVETLICLGVSQWTILRMAFPPVGRDKTVDQKLRTLNSIPLFCLLLSARVSPPTPSDTGGKQQKLTEVNALQIKRIDWTSYLFPLVLYNSQEDWLSSTRNTWMDLDCIHSTAAMHIISHKSTSVGT